MKAALLMLCLLPAPVSAAAAPGASFLRIDPAARPAALGGAFTALSGLNAAHYNPAGLAPMTRREAGFTHTEYLLDTRLDVAQIAQPTRWGTLGLGVTRLNAGGFEGRAADRRSTGGFTAVDEAYALSFGRGFGTLGLGKVSAGASVKYLRSTIGAYSADAVALDLGAQQQIGGSPVTVGVAVRNIGRGMRFLDQRDPLPLSAGVGAAITLNNLLTVSVDVQTYAHGGGTEVGIGSEYALNRGFVLRAGYVSGLASLGDGQGDVLGGLGGGFGMRFGRYTADYTFTPFGLLGNVQRISLGAAW